MELRAVLVDDEQLAREELGYLLTQIDGVEVIGEAGNGKHSKRFTALPPTSYSSTSRCRG